MTKSTISADRRRSFDRLTVGHAVYGLILVAAIILRIWSLDRTPLSPDEARQSLAVWRQWQPGQSEISIASPLYFSLTALISSVFGINDVIARLIPAIFGVGLVVLPWFLRHLLGQSGMLIAAILLTLSPIHNLVSRTAGGESAALFASLLVFVAWVRHSEMRQTRWLLALVAGMAILLASAPLAFTALSSLALAWLAQKTIGPALFDAERSAESGVQSLNWDSLRNCLLIGAGIYVIVASFFFLRIEGIGAAADLPIHWLGKFSGPRDLVTLLSPIFLLGRYETAVILLGFPAVIWATWEARPYPAFLAYWIIGTLVLAFLQPGHQVNIALLTVPSFLLVGFLGDELLQPETGSYKWIVAGVLTLFGAIAYINFIRFLRISEIAEPGFLSYNMFIVMLSGLAAALGLSIVWSWDIGLGRQGIFIFVLLITAIYSWGTTWWMTRQGANDTREGWVAVATDDDVPLLANTAREISRQVTGTERDLQVLNVVDSPVLDWYFREMIGFQNVEGVPPIVDSEALITTESELPILEQAYTGTDFGYVRSDAEYAMTLIQTLNSWLFHRQPQTLEVERVIFWLRADLPGTAQ